MHFLDLARDRRRKGRPKRPAPSKQHEKLTQVAKSARRLLKSLGIEDPDNAVDGPGDHEIFRALVLAGEPDENAVLETTRRIGRLVEILEGIAAAGELERRAHQAATELAAVGELTVREGNPGDDAVNDWIAARSRSVSCGGCCLTLQPTALRAGVSCRAAQANRRAVIGHRAAYGAWHGEAPSIAKSCPYTAEEVESAVVIAWASVTSITAGTGSFLEALFAATFGAPFLFVTDLRATPPARRTFNFTFFAVARLAADLRLTLAFALRRFEPFLRVAIFALAIALSYRVCNQTVSK